jgi:hypothetical protein
MVDKRARPAASRTYTVCLKPRPGTCKLGCMRRMRAVEVALRHYISLPAGALQGVTVDRGVRIKATRHRESGPQNHCVYKMDRIAAQIRNEVLNLLLQSLFIPQLLHGLARAVEMHFIEADGAP